MFQHSTGLCAVLEERAAVLLDGQRSAQAVLHHGDRREANQPVESQTWHVKHLVPAEDNVLVLFARRFICVGVVDVIDLAMFITVYLDVLREQWIDAHHTVLAVADDLAVGVAVEQQMYHHGLAPGEARHLRVWLPVDDGIQRMIRSHLFPCSAVGVAVQMKGQLGNRLRQQSHTGIDRSDLHRGLLVHLLAAVRSAEAEYRAGVADVVLKVWQPGDIPGLSQAQSFKDGQWHTSLKHL